ncbi:hypothetical protein JX265_000026 [Neoarthrinium moseri]|uniref:Uncharacterized protein n=1 Tax=Neoarthrinium moseri TaxID=1658444 RepID=A0A9P9WY88_9PEZI|nr:hypothetical protein JX265_000026 [Neoarthrinium moseri]
MHGLLRAAVLLAPALATGLAIQPEEVTPSAFIRLDLPHVEDDTAREEATLRLDVLKAEESCGHGNVALNGQSLAQDSAGLGAGSITTDQGSLLIASWKFTCVDVEDQQKEQMMELSVDFIDGKEVKDVSVTIQFQQRSPMSISYVDGADSVITSPQQYMPDMPSDDGHNPELEAHIAELEEMKLQLVELEQAIFMKVQFMSEAFGFQEKSSKVTECDNLKCIFLSMYDSVKGVATKFYGHGLLEDGFGGPPGRPFGGHGRGRHGKPGGHHGFPFPHHGNHTHGNHTFPPPPPHGKPHFPPPFCHCEPPPPPPHGPHHGPPHGGPDRHHGPPPPHHGPPHGGPEGHHGGPPPPDHGPGKKPHNGEERPPFGHHFDGPPPPPHGEPEDLPGRPGADGPPPPPFEAGEPGQEHPLYAPEGDRPPPPHFEGDHPPFHGFGSHHHPPPPPHGLDFHQLAQSAPLLRVFAVVVTLGLLVVALHTRCCTSRRSERRQCRERRAAKRAAIKAKLASLIQRLKNMANRNSDDEEKEAIMRRIHAEDNDDSDAVSTTMEQDIEQFRNAADVVSDMVAAEEGRARQEMAQYAMPVPPSPHSAFPDYLSVDEALPAYDEGSDDSSYVADGIRYSPGNSSYTPSISSQESSLDEHLGRKN